MVTATQATRAIKLVVNAILETIRESGDQGAPSGTLYAAMATQGFPLQRYQEFMDTLESMGYVTHRGNIYYATNKR